LDFVQLFGVTTNIELNSTVLSKYEYVEDGTTHIVLRMNNNTYPWVETTPKDVATIQWNELLATQPAQNVTAHVEKRADKWIMTYFDNLSLP
jgi:hypothetical protein